MNEPYIAYPTEKIGRAEVIHDGPVCREDARGFVLLDGEYRCSFCGARYTVKPLDEKRATDG